MGPTIGVFAHVLWHNAINGLLALRRKRFSLLRIQAASYLGYPKEDQIVQIQLTLFKKDATINDLLRYAPGVPSSLHKEFF